FGRLAAPPQGAVRGGQATGLGRLERRERLPVWRPVRRAVCGGGSCLSLPLRRFGCVHGGFLPYAVSRGQRVLGLWCLATGARRGGGPRRGCASRAGRRRRHEPAAAQGLIQFLVAGHGQAWLVLPLTADDLIGDDRLGTLIVSADDQRGAVEFRDFPVEEAFSVLAPEREAVAGLEVADLPCAQVDAVRLLHRVVVTGDIEDPAERADIQDLGGP